MLFLLREVYAKVFIKVP